MKSRLLAALSLCGINSIYGLAMADELNTPGQPTANTGTTTAASSPASLSATDKEMMNELDPFGSVKAPKSRAQIEAAGQPAQPSEKTQAKGLFKDLEKLGADIGKAGVKTLEGTKHVIGGADDLVKGADALVKGAEAAPKALVTGVEAAPKAVIKGTKSVINDVAFPSDANSMDYDGDI